LGALALPDAFWLTGVAVSVYSPEDHAVLEAEYQRNPKPDKVARASIVSRVSLGEKEVQVCFSVISKSPILSTLTLWCFVDLVPEPPPERPPQI
jgi:hypothetical protein